MIVFVKMSARTSLAIDTNTEPTGWTRVYGEGNNATGMIYTRATIIAGPARDRQVWTDATVYARKHGITMTGEEWDQLEASREAARKAAR